MKAFIFVLALVSATTVFAKNTNKSFAKDFYHGSDMMQPCSDFADDSYPDDSMSSSRPPLVEMCLEKTKNLYLTKSKFMSSWVLNECLGNTPHGEASACLERANGVKIPAGAEAKCKGLSLQKCLKLYTDNSTRDKLELYDKLMKDLSEAAEKGNLSKVRLILDTIEGRDSSLPTCTTKMEGSVNDSHLQKLSDESDKIIEKNKKNTSK